MAGISAQLTSCEPRPQPATLLPRRLETPTSLPSEIQTVVYLHWPNPAISWYCQASSLPRNERSAGAPGHRELVALSFQVLESRRPCRSKRSRRRAMRQPVASITFLTSPLPLVFLRLRSLAAPLKYSLKLKPQLSSRPCAPQIPLHVAEQLRVYPTSSWQDRSGAHRVARRMLDRPRLNRNRGGVCGRCAYALSIRRRRQGHGRRLCLERLETSCSHLIDASFKPLLYPS